MFHENLQYFYFRKKISQHTSLSSWIKSNVGHKSWSLQFEGLEVRLELYNRRRVKLVLVSKFSEEKSVSYTLQHNNGTDKAKTTPVPDGNASNFESIHNQISHIF